MREYINTTIEEIKNDNNPLVSFSHTYTVHEILEELGFWERRTERVETYDFFFNRMNKTVETKTVNKFFRFRVDHGNGYFTQNVYYVGQTTPEITDIKDQETLA